MVNKPVILGTTVVLLGAALAAAREPLIRARVAVNIPDIPGYVTLK
jgi:hypothetical protein